MEIIENKIRIKLCGLTRPCDMEAVNELRPDYIGFVFTKKSSRYVSPEQAAGLRKLLCPGISAVGVFVNEEIGRIAALLAAGVIDIVQLHGAEDESYISRLREHRDCPVIKAFRVDGEEDIEKARASTADYVLLDAGNGGTGTAFDRKLLVRMDRPYFLAGGLEADTVGELVKRWRPYGVDVSSGIETEGVKDAEKMQRFVEAVRNV